MQIATAQQVAPGDVYDVVIAGAGSGGTAAALQAARMGMHVALLEETDWIGGQMTAAGVSTMDEGNHLTPPSGLYKEMLDRLDAYYALMQKPVGTCYWAATTHCYEPSAIRKVLLGMITDTNRSAIGHIDLQTRERVVAVRERAGTVVGVATSRGRELSSKILIDATEYGDILPLTSVQVRAGKGLRGQSAVSCTQAITYTMVLKKYPAGVPTELQMHYAPPGYDAWRSQLVHQLRTDGNPNGPALPVSFPEHNAYRGLPDSSSPGAYTALQASQITKTGLNWFNDLPADTRIFDRATRREFECKAKLASLANLYYIQNELGEKNWSVANDEGYDTAYNREENECRDIPQEFKAIEHNMAQAAYVRESQRMVGVATLRAADIRRDQSKSPSVMNFPDAIAVGDYADDLHGCASDEDFERDIERATDIPTGFRTGPFQVPMSALIPEHLDGFLAAEKNLSQGRAANGATRLQPITMLTGEAAGTLAALAVRRSIPPRKISVAAVQAVLLKAGSILAREPMSDVQQGSPMWAAANFAVVHGWIDSPKGTFGAEEPLTHAEAARLLARAYALLSASRAPDPMRDPVNSSFSDLPLYHPASASAEHLKTRGVLFPCRQDARAFCPGDITSADEFQKAMDALSNTPPKTIASPAQPLTRGEAVRFLFDRLVPNDL